MPFSYKPLAYLASITSVNSMKWSFKIATVAGTEVRIHITFFILLIFVAMQGMAGGHGLNGAFDAVLFVSAAFVCVLLHEFGHVFAASGYGIRTPDITLLPIGGVARLERMPNKPSQEFVVAVCGPFVNVAIATAIYLFVGIGLVANPDFHFEQSGRFWEKLMAWNLMMVAFNMIPAFPMDGGRVLRAFLAMLMDYGRATRWAATVGQGIALATALWMLLSGNVSPVLLLIAFFIFMAAGQEAASVTQREATSGLRVRDAMLTDFRVLSPDATLRDAVDLLLAGSQHDFPMMDEKGDLLGILTRQRLISGLSEHGASFPAKTIIEPCEQSVTAFTVLSEAMEQLSASTCPALPVMDTQSGRLVGLLTAENVGELMMIKAALKRA